MATKTPAVKTTAKRTTTTAAKAKGKTPRVLAPTGVASNAIERKALAMDSKSAGMRFLFDNGYTVTKVKTVFAAPYGFVYGVAQRHGVAATAANRKGKAAPTPKAKGRRQSAPVAKVTKVAGSTTRSTAKATTKSATSRVAAKLAAKAAVKPGRPSPARRAANRKTPVVAQVVQA